MYMFCEACISAEDEVTCVNIDIYIYIYIIYAYKYVHVYVYINIGIHVYSLCVNGVRVAGDINMHLLNVL
jgi:hypothetical protein